MVWDVEGTKGPTVQPLPLAGTPFTRAGSSKPPPAWPWMLLEVNGSPAQGIPGPVPLPWCHWLWFCNSHLEAKFLLVSMWEQMPTRPGEYGGCTMGPHTAWVIPSSQSLLLPPQVSCFRSPHGLCERRWKSSPPPPQHQALDLLLWSGIFPVTASSQAWPVWDEARVIHDTPSMLATAPVSIVPLPQLNFLSMDQSIGSLSRVRFPPLNNKVFFIILLTCTTTGQMWQSLRHDLGSLTQLCFFTQLTGFKTEQEHQLWTSLQAASSRGRLWWQALKMINCSRDCLERTSLVFAVG